MQQSKALRPNRSRELLSPTQPIATSRRSSRCSSQRRGVITGQTVLAVVTSSSHNKAVVAVCRRGCQWSGWLIIRSMSGLAHRIAVNCSAPCSRSSRSRLRNKSSRRCSWNLQSTQYRPPHSPLRPGRNISSRKHTSTPHYNSISRDISDGLLVITGTRTRGRA